LGVLLRIRHRPRPRLPRFESGSARLCPHGSGPRPRTHTRPRRHPTPHWLIIGVAAYLKETGDWSILAEPVPYDNAPGSETPLYGHLQRSFRYTLERIGPHGRRSSVAPIGTIAST